ncbi:MAG TPA: hypothetical protein PJ982_06870 [Lacipirellulaceae bacterium]|nr:hypothetical protein [Lacipirellulaceae bacterium]
MLVALTSATPHPGAIAQEALGPVDNCGTPADHGLAEVLARWLAYNFQPPPYVLLLEEQQRELWAWLDSHAMLRYLPYVKEYYRANAARLAGIQQVLAQHRRHEALLRRQQYEHSAPGEAPVVRPLPENARLTVIDGVYDPVYDTQALLVEDRTSGRRYVVFRGTAGAKDWLVSNIGGINQGAERARGGVGEQAFHHEPTYQKLQEWAAYGDLTVVGHSLGGALSQYFIAHFPHAVREGVIFNSAGVPQHVVDEFSKNVGAGRRPPLRIHVNEADLVSNGGGRTFLPGSVVVYKTPNAKARSKTLEKHSAWLLSSDAGALCDQINHDDFLRIRNAARTQDLGVGPVLLVAGGYLIESEIGTGVPNTLIDVLNGGLDGVDYAIGGAQFLVNAGVDALETINRALFPIYRRIPRAPDLRFPRTSDVGRLPEFGGYLPDFSGARRDGTTDSGPYGTDGNADDNHAGGSTSGDIPGDDPHGPPSSHGDGSESSADPGSTGDGERPTDDGLPSGDDTMAGDGSPTGNAEGGDSANPGSEGSPSTADDLPEPPPIDIERPPGWDL